MLRFAYTSLAALCLGGSALYAASAQDVLDRMDRSAGSFESISGNIRKVGYTKVIDDKSEETGTILLRRIKPKGLQALIDFTKPDARTVAFSGTKAEIFYPKLNTVQEYNLSKYSDMVDQFLLVGFGTSGKDLAANYDVKAAGEENIGGVTASHLELTPKSAARREKLKLLELWIAPEGYPVQQKFVQPTGDYTSFTYTNVKLNPQLAQDALKLKLPKGAKREYPQK